MSFWLSYPISNILYSYVNCDAFHSLIYTEKEFRIPNGLECNIWEFGNEKVRVQDLSDLQTFLSDFFGNADLQTPKQTPKLQIPVDKLLMENDSIITLKQNNTIIASIRYKYLGKFLNNEDCFCEDCFCVHPEWRNKGLGRFLLNKLHIYVNSKNIPYSIFLKEGKIVNAINKPKISGVYVYRNLDRRSRIICKTESTKQKTDWIIKSLAPKKAHKILSIFQEIHNNRLFIILNKNNSDNQIWRLFISDTNYILACFQDTYQRFNNKIIGWCTGWIESPNLPSNIRELAAIELTSSVSNEYDMIWMNSKWVGESPIWKIDGGFHWYTYQWTSAINVDKSYAIIM
jgi:GNAT superfamily N-acetyltransferase